MDRVVVNLYVSSNFEGVAFKVLKVVVFNALATRKLIFVTLIDELSVVVSVTPYLRKLRRLGLRCRVVAL
jgi:hypothetical protein